MRFIDHLKESIRKSAVHNQMYEIPPACILWPDKDKEWLSVIGILQKEMPELFILGGYNHNERTGPAIWLRCVLSNAIDEIIVSPGSIPIIYLPGYSRQELKPVDNCPEELKILASYQYLGVIWFQSNYNDWTLMAMLQSSQGGLGLDVSQNTETKNALQVVLSELLYAEISFLKNNQLNADFLYSMLLRDEDRSFLEWLNKGEIFKRETNEKTWKAIVEKTKAKYKFNIETDGLITAAENLATHNGRWQQLWERFCESPKRYPNIPVLIRKCSLPENITSSTDQFDGWPQWNDTQEKKLCHELLSLAGTLPDEARKKVIQLDQSHCKRRNLVWKELNESPLAISLEYLAIIASLSQKKLTAGTMGDIVKAYTDYGYKIDDSVLKSLEVLKKPEDYKAVSIAIEAMYKPWIEESALYFQKLVTNDIYQFISPEGSEPFDYQDGDCILFVDGLRYDTAKRLSSLIKKSGYTCKDEITWAALPTVTATGKAAVMPDIKRITGKDINCDFIPYIMETEKNADTANLRKLLSESDWTYLEKTNNGDGSGKAWCEEGNIDHEGHNLGNKFPHSISSLLLSINERIISLLGAGWQRVFIVSDHGWLYLPGGLPQDAKLLPVLTEVKWGRCAIAKKGVLVDHKQYSWFWNKGQFFIAANGINNFYNGKDYAHGGISIQECLLLRLCVTAKRSVNSSQIIITGTRWRGLTCQISIEPNAEGLYADIRKQPDNSKSSIGLSNTGKLIKPDGTVTIIVPDEDLEGKSVYIVIIDNAGAVLAQRGTVIGSDQPELL
jgi:hypothetical protein